MSDRRRVHPFSGMLWGGCKVSLYRTTERDPLGAVGPRALKALGDQVHLRAVPGVLDREVADVLNCHFVREFRAHGDRRSALPARCFPIVNVDVVGAPFLDPVLRPAGGNV